MLRRIAEGRQAAYEVKRQAEIIRSLLENASDAIIVTDSQGTVQLYNPAAERLIGPMTVGAPPEEWAQSGRARRDDAGTTLPPEELPLARALRREQVVDEEVFIRRPGADVGRWTSVIASSIYNEGDIKVAVVIYRDISEHKRVEEELRHAEERFRLLVQNSSDIITVLTGDGTVLYQSPSIERLLGPRPADRVGRNVFVEPIVHPEDLPRKREFLDEAIRRSGVPVAAEFRLQHADGTWRYIEAVGQNLLADPSVKAIVANYRDITERRQAEERALRAERLAAIGQMVAGLAHESRNALQRGQACLEMLTLQVRDRPAALGLIARLQKAQDDLHHLYEDVRSYAAPIRLERRRCALAPIWREAWTHLESQRSGRSALLRERHAEPEISCAVDPLRLGQVFHNILENALAACPDPVEIDVCCTLAQVDGRSAVRVSVRDNGPGLRPEGRQRIFEPFYTTEHDAFRRLQRLASDKNKKLIEIVTLSSRPRRRTAARESPDSRHVHFRPVEARSADSPPLMPPGSEFGTSVPLLEHDVRTERWPENINGG